MDYPTIENQPIIKEISISSKDEISSDMPCDPWHVGGNSNFHKSISSRDFIEMCKQKMQRRKLNFHVGPTGYIHWDTEIPIGDYCWDIDELGRFVGVIDDIWCFQRYMNGDILVWTPIKGKYGNDWHCLTDAKIDEISDKIMLRF